MQIIQLEVKDDYTSNVMALLNSVKNVMIEKIEIKESIDHPYDPYFKERQSNLQQLRDAIDNGTIKTHDEDEFENIMDQYEKDLVLKYAH